MKTYEQDSDNEVHLHKQGDTLRLSLISSILQLKCGKIAMHTLDD